MNILPNELTQFLSSILSANITYSLMIWGPPGIGKSSIVKKVCIDNNMDFIDLRLSRLAPTDLRGLPVPEDGVSKWYPPEFLPKEGRGVLFLDEINMAPPTLQGIAQQLILDRQVGAYELPKDWFIWAAGNRIKDQTSVFKMPPALANRFMHLEVKPDLDSFLQWSLENNIHEQIMAFIAFRPTLLHKPELNSIAWPSPRTWQIASELHKNKLSVKPAVGNVATEFEAYLSVYDKIPDIDNILAGDLAVSFPKEPSMRYAVVFGLVHRSKDNNDYFNAFKWMILSEEMEWIQFLISYLFPQLRKNNTYDALIQKIMTDSDLKKYLNQLRDIILDA